VRCPSCGGALRRIGEDVTETLDYVPGDPAHPREAVVPGLRYVVAAPAPDHAIARGRAGAGLLAHIVVSKYDDHLPRPYYGSRRMAAWLATQGYIVNRKRAQPQIRGGLPQRLCQRCRGKGWHRLLARLL
jgi:transposase